VNIQEIEKALEHAEKFGPVGEFVALQDIMANYALQGHVFNLENNPEIYAWYVDRLIQLHDILYRQLENYIPYRIDQYNPRKLTLARIRAVLDTLPDVVSESKDTVSSA
jgi:hypothetical protein